MGAATQKDELLAEFKAEYEKIQARVKENQQLIEQTQHEVNRMRERSVAIRTQLSRVRSMRNFGVAGLDTVTDLGTNGKMSGISAAMGLTSLESLHEFISTNYRNYCAYVAGLEDVPGVQLIQYDPKERNNYQYIVIEIDEKKAGLSRDQLVQILHAENIRARRYFYPGCHQMEPYRSSLSKAAWSFRKRKSGHKKCYNSPLEPRSMKRKLNKSARSFVLPSLTHWTSPPERSPRRGCKTSRGR